MSPLSFTSLPPPVAASILRLLPVADRVRAGGVSPAWRAVAHAPAVYGPELVLREALDAPRTVEDARRLAAVGAGRAAPQLSREAAALRCSAAFVLRSLAALAAGTLTRLDATHSSWALIPDAICSEAIVAICAANHGLTRVAASAPTTLPGALQLLRRCPRVQQLTLPRVGASVTADTLAALSPEERALSERLVLGTLDLGRKICKGPSVYDYAPPLPDYLGALTTAEARSALGSIRDVLSAISAGAWGVTELHLPGCKADDSVLVPLLAALRSGAGGDGGAACCVRTLVLHYSFKDAAQTRMSAAAAAALAATLDALPSLTALRFQDTRNPEVAMLENENDGEGYDESYEQPMLSSYLFAAGKDEPQLQAAYKALHDAAGGAPPHVHARRGHTSAPEPLLLNEADERPYEFACTSVLPTSYQRACDAKP
jgi:hypothetical protein